MPRLHTWKDELEPYLPWMLEPNIPCTVEQDNLRYLEVAVATEDSSIGDGHPNDAGCPMGGGDLGIQRSGSRSYRLTSNRLVLTG